MVTYLHNIFVALLHDGRQKTVHTKAPSGITAARQATIAKVTPDSLLSTGTVLATPLPSTTRVAPVAAKRAPVGVDGGPETNVSCTTKRESLALPKARQWCVGQHTGQDRLPHRVMK